MKRFLFHNQSTAQTIAKNTFWLSFGEVFGRLFKVGLIIYAARILGAAGYGTFSYMTSLAAMLTIFSDMGLTGILIREGARSEELRRAYFATSLFIKLIIIVFSFAVIVLVSPRITNTPLSSTLVYAIGLLTVFDALRAFGNAIFRAEERMQFEAGTNILTQVSILAAGMYALIFFPSPETLAIAYALGSAVGLIAITFLVRKYLRSVFKFFRKDLIKTILIAGWPMGISAIFGGFLINTDTVMIGWFKTAEQVGFYSAAQKPIAFLYLLPALIVSGIFPVMARYAKSDRNKFREVMEKGLSMTILIAYPLVAGIALNASQIVELFYGAEFISATAPLIVLSLTLLITFPGTVIMNAIFAFDRQKEMVPVWIIGALLNVSLNLLLIPHIGTVGAALTSLLSQILVTGTFWHKMNKINSFNLFRHAVSIIKATLLVIIGILTMNFIGVPFIVMVLFSILIYLGALLLFKDPTLKDILETIKAHYDTEPYKA